VVGRLVTVGVYGFTAERFLTALKRADVRVPFDVRQRRGVRGSEYAWANSQRLQQALADCGIGYRHLKELAPTSEIRAAQYAADEALGERKRTRTELSEGFKRAYVEQILEPADLDKLLAGFDASMTAASNRAAPATGFPNSPWTSTATVVRCSAPTAGEAAFATSGWGRPPLGSSPKRS
jgi:uncharacterized protein (DUF488 family)